MALVKYNKDIYDTLELLHSACKNPEEKKVLVKKTKGGESWELREDSSKIYLHKKLKIAERTAGERLQFLSENKLIEIDHTRSYKQLKTYKWIYKPTSLGIAWLKANKVLFGR